MQTYRMNLGTKFAVGLVAMFTSFQSVGEPEGEYDEVAYVGIGSESVIICIGSDPGYIYLSLMTPEEIDALAADQEAALLAEGTNVDPATMIVEPPVAEVYEMNGELPEQLSHVEFDWDKLSLIGHDTVTLGPFPTQVVTDGDGTNEHRIVVLKTSYDPDVHIDCDVLDPEEYNDDTGGTHTRLVAKKIPRSSKWKVNRKAAPKKAAPKRKKAAPKRQ